MDKWEAYIKYLHRWADDHCGEAFIGRSPMSYEKWMAAQSQKDTNPFSRLLSGSHFEFISYDGVYPHLCNGELVLKDTLTGTYYHLHNILQSGGRCNNYGGGEQECLQGPWFVDEDKLPYALMPYVDEITELVNESIEHGCCGGCFI